MTSQYEHLFLGRDAKRPAPLAMAHQIHSPLCLEVASDGDNQGEADALFTRQRGLWVGVKTADCTPVLFAGADGVAAAHAGWRGALAGVLEATLQHFNPATTKVLIGPTIQKNSYEVSLGFEEPFLAEDTESGQFFSATNKPDKLVFDLPAYCAFRLHRAGVTSINLSPINTFTDTQFFSHRRMPKEGRNISAIRLI